MRQAVIQKAEERQRRPQPNLTGIPTQMKMDFEQRSGLSFDDVRVHYNSDKPRKIGALAYTQIPQVHIGPGQERHLRHELGHVVQQKQGIVRPTTYINGLPLNDSLELEHAADMGSSISWGHHLSSTGQRSIIQRFRVVMPGQIGVPEGSPEPIFSTNRVVHYPDGNVREDNIPKLNSGIADNKYTELMDVLQSISEQQATGAPTDVLEPLYKRYYQLSGLLSEPQLPGKALGTESFIRRPKLADGNSNQLLLKQSGFWFWKKRTLQSSFRAGQVTDRIKHPMLVSCNSQFALTALYPEPKEVYLADSAKSGVINKLTDASLSLKTIGTKINVHPHIADDDIITMEGYTIEQGDSAFTSSLCDQIRRKLGESRPDRLLVEVDKDKSQLLEAEFSKAVQEYVPWEFHTAARLCVDLPDTLSLENGARRSWLFGKLIELYEELNFSDQESETIAAQVQQIVREMNKTWYFRMYGPHDFGQDIGQQTISRFTPIE